MALDTDFHSHVSRSCAHEMVQSAQQRGLHVLGLSEHIFQMIEARAPLEHMPLEGPILSFSTYLETVRAAAKYFSFDVRLGLEVDFIPEKQEVIQESIKDYTWDFLIGSVHEVDGDRFEWSTPPDREQGEQAWLRYFELLRGAVCSKQFSVVSHPVRMGVRNTYLPATFDVELERLAAEATRHDVALEINGYDLLTYPHLVLRLVKACVLQHTPISVGSDAHTPDQVAYAHLQTEKLLHEAGIHTVRIWKQRIPEEYWI